VVLIRACVAQKCVRDRQRKSAVTAAPFFCSGPISQNTKSVIGLIFIFFVVVPIGLAISPES
jgi:hypothetical protein